MILEWFGLVKNARLQVHFLLNRLISVSSKSCVSSEITDVMFTLHPWLGSALKAFKMPDFASILMSLHDNLGMKVWVHSTGIWWSLTTTTPARQF